MAKDEDRGGVGETVVVGVLLLMLVGLAVALVYVVVS
jgi:hypothetical protein